MMNRLWMPMTAMLLLASCRNSTGSNDTATTTTEPSEGTPRQEHIVRRHVNIPRDFAYITNLSSADIVYTQGNYAIDAEGDSALLHFLDVTFDSNLMTVNIVSENNTDLNAYGNTSNVRLYVSCPELKCISICGNGGFESQATWRADDLQIGVLGSGDLKLGRVECTTFSLQASERGDIVLSDLVADDATLYSRSSATVEAHVNVDNLTVINNDRQSIRLTGKANKLFISKPNAPNLVNEVQLPPTL